MSNVIKLLPNVSLLKYDAACRAVAEARGLDEVMLIRDKALLMKTYAKIAKNDQMVADATAIRWRAERRLGQLMAEQEKTVGKAKPPSGKGQRRTERRVTTKPDGPATLAEAGIDKNLAHRARQSAAPTDAEFEQIVEEALHPPAKADRPALRRPRNANVFDVVTPSARDLFMDNVEKAIEAAGFDYGTVAIDDDVLAAARRAAEAWARCLKQMEERHGR